MDLAFTFGIITDASEEAAARLHTVLDSITRQAIPQHQILVVGNAPAAFNNHPHTQVIPFDETQKPRWITRKKNLITHHARYENIVYLHDYFQFPKAWYAGFQKFGNHFLACMNPILNTDGTRYRDWSLFYDASSTPARAHAGLTQLENLLPYDEASLSKLMYFSGAYFVAKKTVMQELPLDERLSWGQGEDVVWSHRFRRTHDFSINPHSPVQLFGKRKDPIFKEIPRDKLDRLKAFIKLHPPEPGYACDDNMETWVPHGHFGPPNIPPNVSPRVEAPARQPSACRS